MPMYEYTCQKCDHTFEALVFDGEPSLGLPGLRTVVYRLVIADTVLGAQEWNVDA